jgi:hypothetical protein
MLLALGKIALQPRLPVFERDDVVVPVEEQEIADHLNQRNHIWSWSKAGKRARAARP